MLRVNPLIRGLCVRMGENFIISTFRKVFYIVYGNNLELSICISKNNFFLYLISKISFEKNPKAAATYQ